MKKIPQLVLLFAVVLSSTNAFAQFGKNAAKAAKNLASLETMAHRASRQAVMGRPVVTGLPPGIVAGNAVGLLRVPMPRTVTPVTQSYIDYLQNTFHFQGPLTAYPTAESLADIVANEWVKGGKRVLYDDQSALARDLDAFYKGQAKVHIGPDGREVKLYTLPVDGILYKPAEYTDAVVLKSKEHFVIFDVETQTGQIADNIPEVYNLFKPTGEEKIYGDFEEVVDEPFFPIHNSYDRYHIQRVFYKYADGAPAWAQRGRPTQFTSHEDLAQEVASFHHYNRYVQVKNVHTGEVLNVYELPRPLTYAKPGYPAVEIQPSTGVVLYNPAVKEGTLLSREILENPYFYEFVK